MPPEKLPVYVEYLPGVQFATGLLHPYDVQIVKGQGPGGAVSKARASLSDHPERPVAVLLRSRTENPYEVNELRASAKRLLASVYYENWCVAVAVPGLDAWTMTDPRIKRDLESLQDGKAAYTDRAARFVELTQTQPFDETELRKTNADFRALVEFIEKHTRPASTGSSLSA
jgi:hypothetical protein